MIKDNISSGIPAKDFKASQTPPDPFSCRSARKALLRFLISRFPNTFFEKERRPLKIGIAQDILNWFEANPNDQIAIDATLLKSALGTYTSNPRYMLCLQVDAPRLDLTGQPDGKVTIQEAEQAQNKLQTLHHILATKDIKKKLTAKAEAAKRAEALRQKAEKAVKKKEAPKVQSNPKSPSFIFSTQTSAQASSGKLQPIIRFVRKRFSVPDDQK